MRPRLRDLPVTKVIDHNAVEVERPVAADCALLDQPHRMVEKNDRGAGTRASHRENTLYSLLRATIVSTFPAVGSVRVGLRFRLQSQGSGSCSDETLR